MKRSKAVTEARAGLIPASDYDDHSARDRNNNDTSITTRPALTYRQFSTVLAALRFFQERAQLDEIRTDEHFEDVDPLTDPDIDALCESMNLDDASPIIDTSAIDEALENYVQCNCSAGADCRGCNGTCTASGLKRLRDTIRNHAEPVPVLAHGAELSKLLAKAHETMDGDSNDDEHDALSDLVDYLEANGAPVQVSDARGFSLDSLAFPIRLTQQGKNRFAVTYGKQVDARLSYSRAAAKLGEAIMHALACDSRIDNEKAS